MIKIVKRLGFVALFLAFAGFSTAYAADEMPRKQPRVLVSGGEEYVEVNFDDLSNTALRVGALTLNEQPVLDEYAQLFYCKIYEDFFQNDSQWMEVSQAIRKKYMSARESVPQKYFFKTDIMIGRYNSEIKAFPLAPSSVFNKIVSLEFFSYRGIDRCGLDGTKYFPSTYSLELSEPFTLDKVAITSQAMLTKVSEIPIWSGSDKKITGVFFIDIQGYKERILTNLFSKVVYSGNIAKVAFYTDDTLESHIRSIDYKSAAVPNMKYQIPDFGTQGKPKQ